MAWSWTDLYLYQQVMKQRRELREYRERAEESERKREAREKEQEIKRRHRQVESDRRFMESYDPEENHGGKFDAKKYERYLDITYDYSFAKKKFLEKFQIGEYMCEPEEISEDDFLTWEDYKEVNEAREKYLAEYNRRQKIIADEEKKRARIWRVFWWTVFIIFVIAVISS